MWTVLAVAAACLAQPGVAVANAESPTLPTPAAVPSQTARTETPPSIPPEAAVALRRLRVAEWFDPALTGPGEAIIGRALTSADADLFKGRRLVVLVHGIDDDYIMWDELAPALLDAGYVVARFDYPHSQGVTHSADMLGESLRAVREVFGVDRVDLVCHSLGGLVSRDMLTRKAWYGGDARAKDTLPGVGRLILIATPNRGAPLARLLPISHPKTTSWFTRPSTPAAIDAARTPRGGDVAVDLLPESDFLRDLNNRGAGLGGGLPAHVPITNIVSLVVPNSCRRWAEKVAAEPCVRDLLGPETSEQALARFDDAVDTIGDVLVPRNRAELPGIADTVYVEGDHRSVVDRWQISDMVDRIRQREPRQAPAIPIVLERLAREAE